MSWNSLNQYFSLAVIMHLADHTGLSASCVEVHVTF